MGRHESSELRGLVGEVEDCMRRMMASAGPDSTMIQHARQAIVAGDAEQLQCMRDRMTAGTAGGHYVADDPF